MYARWIWLVVGCSIPWRCGDFELLWRDLLVQVRSASRRATRTLEGGRVDDGGRDRRQVESQRLAGRLFPLGERGLGRRSERARFELRRPVGDRVGPVVGERAPPVRVDCVRRLSWSVWSVGAPGAAGWVWSLVPFALRLAVGGAKLFKIRRR